MIHSLSQSTSPNAFLLYLLFLKSVSSPDVLSLLRVCSSLPITHQYTLYLTLPSLLSPSSLQAITSFYQQQLALHLNDASTPYLLVGIARLFLKGIPDSPTLLQAVLAPFIKLVEPLIQVAPSRRRGASSSLSIEALKLFAKDCHWQFTTEHSMTILTSGFSLLPWLQSHNESLFTELLSICLECCKSKYPIEFKMSSLLSIAQFLNGSVSLSDSSMKRVEVLLMNGANYTSRLNPSQECCMTCNLLLHHYLSKNPSVQELLQNNRDYNQWILDDDCSSSDLQAVIHLRSQYHWSFIEYNCVIILRH